jgi:DNA-binding IclR family transcriptional regulator
MNTPAHVKSAVRVLDILEMLATDVHAVGVSELARRLRIPKSSTHMLLSTLEGRGYVVSDAARRFQLHPSFRGESRTWVGGAAAGRLLPLARDAMRKLATGTGETSFLGVRRDERTFECIEKVVSESPVAFDYDIRGPRPVHAGSIGLVLLAFDAPDRTERLLREAPLPPVTPYTVCDSEHLRQILAEVRSQGFAVVRDSGALGASSIAAPIFDATGSVIAGVTVSAPSSRFDQILDEARSEVVNAAAMISRELAGSPHAAA